MKQILALALVALLVAVGTSDGESDSPKLVWASEITEAISLGESIDYDNVIVEGDLNLSGETLETAHFNNTIFRGDVYFDETNFAGDAWFWDANFSSFAYFARSNFRGNANFWRAKFGRYADFSHASFSGGDIDFGHARFSGGDADFRYANFSGGDIDFRYANFSGGDVFFNEAEFSGGDAKFSDATFFGGDSTYFSKAVFSGGKAYFINAEFCNDVDFTGVEVNKGANFNNAEFGKNADFTSSRFKEDALFEDTVFRGKLHLARARYDKLFIRWEIIKDKVDYDETAYLLLLKNFKDLGYLEDYDYCYFEYRKERRHISWPLVGDAEEILIRKPIDWFLQVAYGYGTKPLRPLVLSLVIIGLFGIFWLPIKQGKTEKSPDVGSLANAELDSLLDVFAFSATVFLSGTRLFIEPPPLPKIQGRSRSRIRGAFILERVLGALFSILFFLAVSGTIVR